MADTGITLGKAYVQIMPSAEGIKSRMEAILGKEMPDGKESGGQFGQSFGKGFAKACAAAAKVGAAALTATTAAAGAVLKQALDSYAEYEQLAGGAELLFGDAYRSVAQHASEAYAKVQMSQNEYLQQVNGFATGLKTALGGNEQAAADLADKIITAEADIVAATGNSQENIQNAFNGIMRSNYTMLDNLQLGITPTKAGFQELIDKVNEWNAANGNATHYIIDNLADCQSALVDYVNMQGLAGYATREAAGTIQGSLAMTKAAWSNLLTGLGNENADLDTLIGGLVDSVSALTDNILPVIERALAGIGDLVTKLAPTIAGRLPGLIQEVLPGLAAAGAQLLAGIAQGLLTALPQMLAAVAQTVPTLVTALQAAAPQLMEAGAALLSMLGNGIMEGLPMLGQWAVELMAKLGTYLHENLPALLQAGLEMLVELTASIRENAGLIIDGAISLAKSLAQGLADSIPTIIENVPTIVSNIANTINDNGPKILAAAVNIIGTLIRGLISAIPTLVANIPQIISAIVDTITAFNWINLGKTIIKSLGNGIKAMGSGLRDFMSQSFTGAIDFLKSLPSKALVWGKDMISGFVDGIIGSIGGIINAVKNIGSTIASYLHFSRPDIGPLRDYEAWMPDMVSGMAASLRRNQYMLASAAQQAAAGMYTAFQGGAPASMAQGTAAGSAGHMTVGSINLYIQGSEGQNVNELADIVLERLSGLFERKEAQFA